MRALNRHTANRTLFKDHTAQLADLRFFRHDHERCLLASVDVRGQVRAGGRAGGRVGPGGQGGLEGEGTGGSGLGRAGEGRRGEGRGGLGSGGAPCGPVWRRMAGRSAASGSSSSQLGLTTWLVFGGVLQMSTHTRTHTHTAIPDTLLLLLCAGARAQDLRGG